jgi:glycosyltransferase involved in cell wall biosynthesis
MTDARRPLLDLHHLGLRQTGNETWARSLAAAMFALDGPGAYDIAVTTAASSQDLAALPARHTVVVGSSSARRIAWDLPASLRRLRSSAVLVQYTAPVSTVPAVVAVHDLSFEDPRAAEWLPAPSRLRYRATIRASVRHAAHVLALSDHTRDDLVHRYGVDPGTVTVAPAAVDPAFAALLEATPVRRDGPETVLAVGNVVPRKNLVVLAHAVRMLRSGGRDVVLRVVGSVPPRSRRLATEMADLLGDALELTDHVSREELARAYRSAHVLAFPSLFEGFGIPVVEAMEAGLPVVVSDRTSLPGIVADAGLVVPATDPRGWADALATALEPSGRATLVSRGSRRVRDFSWDESAAKVRSVLRAVTGQARPQP